MATINDIVLIYLEASPVCFARIESILPDAKKGWYQIKLLMLQIPLQVVTWILKEEYLNGDEFFMNGKQMNLKKVECPIEAFASSTPTSLPEKKSTKEVTKKTGSAPHNTDEAQHTGKIISFPGLKNKDPEK
ncbi:MAG: hypothetical protein ABIJ31_09220 [Pseudomonadota bacterium]